MDKKSLIAIGTGLALSLAISASYADSNTMQATQMGSGQSMQKADGQYGANKMGAQQKNTDGASVEGNKADGSCGTSMKASDGSCGSNMKDSDGSCGSNMKDSDGSCGANMKDSDGSCGASNTDQ
ncbi:hypothetical protein [Caedibacter taeniospiralis]|uniref:hypothetical protein n=1 Tax=Caedibacter taeniospiralis TaxID=28907 RepID=UPI0037BEBA53